MRRPGSSLCGLLAGVVAGVLGLSACKPAPAPPVASSSASAAPSSATPVSTAPIPAVASVGLEEDGGTFVVPVVVNDAITLKFTLDSGASDVTLPSDVVSTLIRSGSITQADYIGAQTFVLADGSQVPSAEFRIHSLKVGNLVLHNVTGSVAGENGGLLLGQSFLSRLSSWSIDNGQHVLLLKAAANADTPPAPATPPPGAPAAANLSGGEPKNLVAVDTVSQAEIIGRAEQYMAAWSNPEDPGGEGVRRYYADTVRFYGKPTPIDQLMAQKAAFASRWPSRRYAIRAGSLSTQCADRDSCTLSGVLDWQAANAAANLQSTGSANFQLGFRDGLIVSEGGSVISRQ